MGGWGGFSPCVLWQRSEGRGGSIACSWSGCCGCLSGQSDGALGRQNGVPSDWMISALSGGVVTEEGHRSRSGMRQREDADIAKLLSSRRSSPSSIGVQADRTWRAYSQPTSLPAYQPTYPRARRAFLHRSTQMVLFMQALKTR